MKRPRILSGRLLLLATLTLCGAPWLNGCNPKPLAREPIVVIADELVYMPAGVAYTPTKDGYWVSKEGLMRLLEKLEDQQYQLDSIPKAQGMTFDFDSYVRMPSE